MSQRLDGVLRELENKLKCEFGMKRDFRVLTATELEQMGFPNLQTINSSECHVFDWKAVIKIPHDVSETDGFISSLRFQLSQQAQARFTKSNFGPNANVKLIVFHQGMPTVKKMRAAKSRGCFGFRWPRKVKLYAVCTLFVKKDAP